MLKEIIIALLAAGCVFAVPQVPRNNDQLISNRRETTIEEFSYLVSITAWNFHICTGIILNQNTILTTVSCTQGQAAIHFTVRAGSNRVDSGGQVIPVIQIIEHELNTDPFDWSFEYDIAILKLRRNLVFSASVRAIQLPAPGFNVPHGSIATITGWAIFMDNFEASVLETTQISIVENAQCEPPITRHIVRPDQICAVPEYDIEEDIVCYSDGGSPLIFQGRLVGIVPFVMDGGCSAGLNILYQRVSEFLPFIIRNM